MSEHDIPDGEALHRSEPSPFASDVGGGALISRTAPADPLYREYYIVTGGRDFRDGKALYGALDALLAFSRPEWFVLVHGRCKTGADAIADTWARSREVDCESYPAQWTRQGKRAGPLRNQRMLATILARRMPTMVIHCPGGDGTADMMWRVEAAIKCGHDIKVSPVYDPHAKFMRDGA